MTRNRNANGTSRTKARPGRASDLPFMHKALLPAAVLGLVLTGCSAQEEPEAVSSKPATSSATAEETATASPSARSSSRSSIGVELPPGSTEPPVPNDPAMTALFRADNPISLESYFQQNPKWRPLNADLVLEEPGTGRSTFDLPKVEPGTSFSVFLTCNQPGDYSIEVLDADSSPVTTSSSSNCNWPVLTSFEHIVTPDQTPASITVDGPDGDYWLVVYNLPVPTMAPETSMGPATAAPAPG